VEDQREFTLILVSEDSLLEVSKCNVYHCEKGIVVNHSTALFRNSVFYNFQETVIIGVNHCTMVVTERYFEKTEGNAQLKLFEML